MIWFFVKSKQEIISDYNSKLVKEGKVITTQESKILLDDMILFFDKNPKTKKLFIKERGK